MGGRRALKSIRLIQLGYVLPSFHALLSLLLSLDKITVCNDKHDGTCNSVATNSPYNKITPTVRC